MADVNLGSSSNLRVLNVMQNVEFDKKIGDDAGWWIEPEYSDKQIAADLSKLNLDSLDELEG